jgi:hypothetical protein
MDTIIKVSGNTISIDGVPVKADGKLAPKPAP